MNLPRLVIAGTSSGVGKTTLATAVMAALTRRGYRVQGFKAGPDYIDPGYHRLATGRFSRNLDSWMLGTEKVVQSFCRAGSRADLSIVEGVMGLFDGAQEDGTGSTAEVALTLKAPVILVVDVRSMAQSAAAVISGYQKFQPQLNLAGVILNRVGSEKHRRVVAGAVENYCRLPVIGAVFRDARLSTPERHLGLLPVPENNAAGDKVETLGKYAEKCLDLDLLVQIAGSAPPLRTNIAAVETAPKIIIAVAWDEAFNFYYQDGLDTLTALGAKLVFFSPLHDHKLPAGARGLIIGGGFPEMYLRELAANREMLAAIDGAYRRGMPIYAECGGFMYLARGVTDLRNHTFSLAGIVPGYCVMRDKLAGMGYVTARAQADNILCDRGCELKGHEFHYSDYYPVKHLNAFKFYGGRGRDGRPDGYARENLLATYLHLNFFGDRSPAVRFIDRCLKWFA